MRSFGHFEAREFFKRINNRSDNIFFHIFHSWIGKNLNLWHQTIFLSKLFQIRNFHSAFESSRSFLLPANVVVHLIIFLAFLILLRNAQQIILPYNDNHDVFELNRILDEKLEVASFVLDKKCDLRKEIRNAKLLP